MIRSMNKDPIVFAMANPVPEIWPDEACEAGAAVVGTGRSDFPNQINNVLAFPGIFRGALDARAKRITDEMKIAAAHAIADYVKKPHRNRNHAKHPGQRSNTGGCKSCCTGSRFLRKVKTDPGIFLFFGPECIICSTFGQLVSVFFRFFLSKVP